MLKPRRKGRVGDGLWMAALTPPSVGSGQWAAGQVGESSVGCGTRGIGGDKLGQ